MTPLRSSLRSLLVLASLGQAATAALKEAASGADVAREFPAAGWAATDKGYGGPADGRWSYALGGEATWTDYRVDCRVDLVKPADRRDGMEIGCFAVFQSLANLGGYEAAVVVRHESAARHYRVAISSLWKEIILWRPNGGVVQVEPFAFEAGKSYRLSVACQGPQIAVSVDGQTLLTWQDTADPVRKGQAGLARKEGESYFTAVKVEALPAATPPAAAHQPQFREVQWHGYRFFFDGREPVFMITGSNVLDLMKFMPGYRPILYTYNYITDWNRFYPTKTVDSKATQTGQRLVIDTVAVDPDAKKQSKIACQTRLEVTYDPGAGLYVYDQQCTVDLPADECDKVGPAWDHGDAVFLGGVGHAQTRDPKAFSALYHWAVFQADDGRHYKIPMNHNGHYLGQASTNGGPLKPDGGEWVVVDDPVLSPVVKVMGKSENFSHVTCGHCWWAYDMHTLFHIRQVEKKTLPGSYISRVRYLGRRAAEARQRLAEAAFYKPADLTVKVPVYTAGLGFTEPFDKEVLLASPHQEHRIWAGRLDRTVGHGDSSSLRLDGPTEAWCITGSSYFMTGYAKRNRVTLWVKTQDVEGDGPAVGFRRWDTNRGEFYPTGLTGTRDWTRVQFLTGDFLEHWGVTLYWRNAGSGTVWIDDFLIEPLPEGAAADAPAGRPYPLNPPDPDVVLRWEGKGTAQAVLDQSGYGHHGKLYDEAAWVEEDGRRVLSLGGQSAYIWPLCSPHLTLGPPMTLVVRLKPEAPGYLTCWWWNFNYHLTGTAPKLGVGYQSHVGKLVASKPFLDVGQWQTLAVVAADNQIRLYRDGQPVETLAAELKAGDWGLHTGTTWHRHLSFFGSGPGDMTLLPQAPAPGLKGRVASLIVYKRALTDAEIAARGAPAAK